VVLLPGFLVYRAVQLLVWCLPDIKIWRLAGLLLPQAILQPPLMAVGASGNWVARRGDIQRTYTVAEAAVALISFSHSAFGAFLRFENWLHCTTGLTFIL
jgi:hypothetical protein